jgi:hypothetical protein
MESISLQSFRTKAAKDILALPFAEERGYS